MFDAAHAFGCSHGGRMIGSFGLAEVFSFHATKFINSFEGGAVVTNNSAYADKLRLMRNFGFAGYDKVIYIGTNGKMCEAAAAMGLTSLEAIADFIAANRRNYESYCEELKGIAGLSLMSYNRFEKNNFQYIIIDVDADRLGLTRDELQATLQAENVLARRYFYPGCHRMEPYVSRFPHAGRSLPETERLASQVLLLPTGISISRDAIHTIGDILRLASRAPNEVRRVLHSTKYSAGSSNPS
jgi:dTDP-4-amino-4,6-dideoxygalactose transaminase